MLMGNNCAADEVSIHALARRATLPVGTCERLAISFQSTPSHGGRLDETWDLLRDEAVSIHALARRATMAGAKTKQGGVVSIHALARRATLVERQNPRNQPCFNPRPRTEGDPEYAMALNPGEVSIHALARRATLSAIEAISLDLVSIHALARRATSGQSGYV